MFITSCKKKKLSLGTPTSNYAQLKVGNYWVYQQFEIDVSHNETALNKFDSCYIEKDTMINGNTYAKMVRPTDYGMTPYNIYFLRDSSSYIVSSAGDILFSSEDFSTVFNETYILAQPQDTVCKISSQMKDKDQEISTPAGHFITSNFNRLYQMYPKYSAAGNPRNMNTRYAKNVGIVLETLPFYSSNPNYIERRLIRYHVN
jgi:hypothetical protein